MHTKHTTAPNSDARGLRTYLKPKAKEWTLATAKSNGLWLAFGMRVASYNCWLEWPVVSSFWFVFRTVLRLKCQLSCVESSWPRVFSFLSTVARQHIYSLNCMRLTIVATMNDLASWNLRLACCLLFADCVISLRWVRSFYWALTLGRIVTLGGVSLQQLLNRTVGQSWCQIQTISYCIYTLFCNTVPQF
jgi:hypothetical protein